MKILITGAGTIGTIYGWALSEGGHEVVHWVRAGKASRFASSVPVDVFDRRKGRKRYFRGLYRLKATETLSPLDHYELIVVPTKHYQLADALRALVPGAGQADFLLLTQNWQGTEDLESIIPRSRYVYGDAKAGGAYREDTLVCALAGLDIGPAEGKPTPLAAKVAAIFATARVPTTVHTDMLHYLWIQYAILAGLWPALVRAGSMDAVLRDPSAGKMAMSAVRECLEVVARRGVDLGLYPETRLFLRSGGLRRWLGIWMFRLALRYSEFVKRCSLHALGDPGEIKTFYDDLTSTGRRLGVPMPVMDRYAADIADLVNRSPVGALSSA